MITESEIGRKISFIGISCTFSENKNSIGRTDMINGWKIKSPLYCNNYDIAFKQVIKVCKIMVQV